MVRYPYTLHLSTVRHSGGQSVFCFSYFSYDIGVGLLILPKSRACWRYSVARALQCLSFTSLLVCLHNMALAFLSLVQEFVLFIFPETAFILTSCALIVDRFKGHYTSAQSRSIRMFSFVCLEFQPNGFESGASISIQCIQAPKAVRSEAQCRCSSPLVDVDKYSNSKFWKACIPEPTSLCRRMANQHSVVSE